MSKVSNIANAQFNPVAETKKKPVLTTEQLKARRENNPRSYKSIKATQGKKKKERDSKRKGIVYVLCRERETVKHVPRIEWLKATHSKTLKRKKKNK